MGCFSTIEAIQNIVKAKEAANVEKIIFLVSGPGGPSEGSDDLAGVIYNLRNIKPSFALVDDRACSAHYSFAAATGGIFVCGNTVRLGCIGVVTRYRVNARVPDAKEEVSFLEITESEKKLANSEHTDETEDMREYLLNQQKASQQRFVNTIQSYRGMTDSEIDAVSDGSVFTAPEIFTKKLADGYFDVEAWYAKKQFKPISPEVAEGR